MSLMPQPKFRANLSGSLIIPEQYHFHIRVQQLPALQRVPLNDAVMPQKWLRRGKYRQHSSWFGRIPFKSRIQPCHCRQRAQFAPDVTSAETVPKTLGHTDTMHGSRTASARNSSQNSSVVPIQTKIQELPAAKVSETPSRISVRHTPRSGPRDGECAPYLEPTSGHCCGTRIGGGMFS